MLQAAGCMRQPTPQGPTLNPRPPGVHVRGRTPAPAWFKGQQVFEPPQLAVIARIVLQPTVGTASQS